MGLIWRLRWKMTKIAMASPMEIEMCKVLVRNMWMRQLMMDKTK